jgi:AraC-like DNA-binding protein
MSVAIFFVRTVVDAVERAGADLRSRFPLDWRRLEQPEARVEFDQFAQMLSTAVAITGDEALGLHIAEQMPEGAGDLLAHVAAHAPTMREAVEACSQFVPLAIDGVALGPRDEGDVFVVDYAFPRSTPLADRVLAELIVAGLVRLARTFTHPAAVPRFVAFEHERPPHHREYARVFGEGVRFGQPGTAIGFGREVADRTQLHRHTELYDLRLRTEARRRVERMGTGARATHHLRQYLLAMPAARIPDISRAARDLGMSERSLRRHLAADGTTYRDVVRSTLEASAGRMLRDPTQSIKETAAALGFANTGAFHRAFKRWTGMTPGDYRRIRGEG